MSIVVPTTYTELRGLQIRPGAKVLDSTWQTLTQNAHHLYARGSERHPIYWSDTPIDTTSTTYVQPDGLDRLTAVWRPTRVAAADKYRLTAYVYGVDADVRVEAFDATVGTNASLGTEVVSCGSTAEWATASLAYAAADVFDGSGDPIPIAFSFELKTSATTAEVYQIHLVSEILTNTTLP